MREKGRIVASVFDCECEWLISFARPFTERPLNVQNLNLRQSVCVCVCVCVRERERERERERREGWKLEIAFADILTDTIITF